MQHADTPPLMNEFPPDSNNFTSSPSARLPNQPRPDKKMSSRR
jgi:hypothetical protein